MTSPDRRLIPSVALDRGMNLAPVRVENAHADDAGRPVNVACEVTLIGIVGSGRSANF